MVRFFVVALLTFATSLAASADVSATESVSTPKPSDGASAPGSNDEVVGEIKSIINKISNLAREFKAKEKQLIANGVEDPEKTVADIIAQMGNTTTDNPQPGKGGETEKDSNPTTKGSDNDQYLRNLALETVTLRKSLEAGKEKLRGQGLDPDKVLGEIWSEIAGIEKTGTSAATSSTNPAAT